jgi:hypothetical protein
VAVQDLADHLRPDNRAALIRPAGRAVNQLPLKGQQLRRRKSLRAQPAIMADPDRPLLEEPVGRCLDLGERLLRA